MDDWACMPFRPAPKSVGDKVDTMTAAEQFRRLHDADRPLLLPNAWDAASARQLVGLGFPAVGSTSLGVAAVHGLPDGAGRTREQTVALAATLVRSVDAFVTMDVENGFSDDPDEVAALAGTLTRLGIVGLNIEDSRPDGTLRSPEDHAAVVAAVKSAAPEVFLNARTDTHWLRETTDATRPDTLRRAEAYLRAGADGIFVPGVADADDLRAYTAAIAAPVNALYNPAFGSVGDLARCGVRRISTGSLLFRVTLGALRGAMEAIRAGEPLDLGGVPGYAEIQGS